VRHSTSICTCKKRNAAGRCRHLLRQSSRAGRSRLTLMLDVLDVLDVLKNPWVVETEHDAAPFLAVVFRVSGLEQFSVSPFAQRPR
jgi:hypothetical protein